MPPDEFGAWGQWAGAIFTAIAVAVALWVAISDVQRRKREIDDQRAAQARTVLAYVAPIRGMLDDPRMAVVVQNYGISPVTAVRVLRVTSISEETGHDLTDWHIEDLTPTHERRSFKERVRIQVQAPGESWTSSSLSFIESSKLTTKFDPARSHVWIMFTDAAGLIWMRDNDGPPLRYTERDLRELMAKW